MEKNTNGKRKQTFTFKAHDAASIQLAGDFTDWEKAPIDLRRNIGGVWQTTVELEPGAHRYRFLVDGKWQDDPACTTFAENPFGTRDAVRQVG